MLAPVQNAKLPDYAFAIDGSHAEVDVKNGYPGAKVGYVTVASVLLNLKRIDELDENRPIDPREFRKTEEASTLDAAMPGCNVVTRTHTSALESFREAFYENFLDVVGDDQDGRTLLDSYEAPSCEPIFHSHSMSLQGKGGMRSLIRDPSRFNFLCLFSCVSDLLYGCAQSS